VDVSEANNPYISNENKKNKGSQMGKKPKKYLSHKSVALNKFISKKF
jgi:hypothetical protein